MPLTSSVLRNRLIPALAVLALACGCQRSGTPVPPSGAVTTEVPAETAIAARDSTDAPADVVRAYYRAITEQRFRVAYGLWAEEGAASGKSFEAFRAGFDSTASVEVVPGPAGVIEGAAGSRYVEIPVRVTAVAKDGRRQVFSGTYTLRRTVVDGASAEQRAWRIHSARIRREG